MLREAGHSVEIVALIDPPTANVRPVAGDPAQPRSRPAGHVPARAYEALSRFGETSKWPYPKRITNGTEGRAAQRAHGARAHGRPCADAAHRA